MRSTVSLAVVRQGRIGRIETGRAVECDLGQAILFFDEHFLLCLQIGQLRVEIIGHLLLFFELAFQRVVPRLQIGDLRLLLLDESFVAPRGGENRDERQRHGGGAIHVCLLVAQWVVFSGAPPCLLVAPDDPSSPRE
jgi:hypothetical protein